MGLGSGGPSSLEQAVPAVKYFGNNIDWTPFAAQIESTWAQADLSKALAKNHVKIVGRGSEGKKIGSCDASTYYVPTIGERAEDYKLHVLTQMQGKDRRSSAIRLSKGGPSMLTKWVSWSIAPQFATPPAFPLMKKVSESPRIGRSHNGRSPPQKKRTNEQNFGRKYPPQFCVFSLLSTNSPDGYPSIAGYFQF